MKKWWNTVVFLWNGKAEIEDTDDYGNEIAGTITLPWSSRWALAGPKPYDWWWVQRWGKLPCGCTRNPLTRNMLLYVFDCPIHMTSKAGS